MKSFSIVTTALFSVSICFGASAETAMFNNPLGLSLDLEPAKEQAYTGESVPVNVTLRVQGVTIRNIGYPHLTQPGGGQIPFSPPLHSSDGESSRSTYRFSGRLIAGTSGEATIGPATVDCEVMEPAAGSAAFFGEVIPRKLTIAAPAAKLVIRPLPAVKPSSFSGAVGSFSMTVVGKPNTIAVGDPLTVTTTISGAGSLAAAACPDIRGSLLQSYPARMTRGEGRLHCEQVIVPNTQALLPIVEWSFFEPDKERYRTLSTSLAETVSINTDTTGIIKPSPTALHANPNGCRSKNISPWWLLALSIPVAVAALLFRSRRSKGTHPVSTSAALLPDIDTLLSKADHALSLGLVDNVYTIIVEILQQYHSDRNGLVPQKRTPAEHGFIDRPATPDAAYTYLSDQCDRVRYGRIIPGRQIVERDLQLVRSLVIKLSR